jgi:hypothetical protein
MPDGCPIQAGKGRSKVRERCRMLGRLFAPATGPRGELPIEQRGAAQAA